MAAPPTTLDLETDSRPRPFHGGAADAAESPVVHPEPADFEGRPVAEVVAEVEEMTAPQAIAWAHEHFGRDLLFATSFQKTSSVMVDLASRASDGAARFFYLDTDLLFNETYATRDALAERYGVEFERYAGVSLRAQEREHGDGLWLRNPDACCGIRKVTPMGEALSGARCWVAGLRRKDSAARSKTPKLAWDKRFGLWKLNPLADWSDVQVWNHIRENEIPYNELHDQGYPSIGCTHCTSRPGAGESGRAGRWANLDKTECGING